MLVLDDARVGNFPLRIIHDRVALVIFLFEAFGFKAQRTVFQLPEPIPVKLVYHARIYGFFRDIGVFLDKIEIIAGKQYLRTFQKFFREAGVAALRDALVAVVEIIVVVRETQGQPLDDERGQIFAGFAPLFFGVALDEFFEHVAPDEFQPLFLEIFRLYDVQFFDLRVDLFPRLARRDHAPHFRKRVHVER